MNFGARPQKEVIFGDITITHADRSPCIICGHPTGDCAGSADKPDHISGIGAFKSVDEKLTFLVEEDIWEERQINPFHQQKILIARKGRYISHAKAEELGLL
jgi:hypothetical protein